MVTPSDLAYRLTKRIKQNKTQMNEDFVPLAAFIAEHFGVKPLNILLDEEGKRVSLEVIFEFGREAEKFMNKDLGYHAERQKVIAEYFDKLIADKGKGARIDMWVTFSAFEPVAKSEVYSSIPHQEIVRMEKENGKGYLWKINRYCGPTFFLYTDQQTEECHKNGLKEKWTEAFFKLLKQYDEFDYFKREDFIIMLDSKENFDTNYQSNWYYYYK